MESKYINRYHTFCKSLKNLAHDYDGNFAAEKFQDIIHVYYPLFEKLRDDAEKYYQ